MVEPEEVSEKREDSLEITLATVLYMYTYTCIIYNCAIISDKNEYRVKDVNVGSMKKKAQTAHKPSQESRVLKALK